MIEILTTYGDLLLEGFINTLIASLIALVMSLIIGTLLGIFQVSTNKLLAGLANFMSNYF